MADLSEYEQQRLANIQQRKAFLATLGLQSTAIKAHVAQEAAAREIKKEQAVGRTSRNKRGRVAASRGTRKSSRLRGVSAAEGGAGAGAGAADDDEDQGTIVYADAPDAPEQLDDFEFQIYIGLRKWRLALSRRLQTESYKIFQNRTLCA